MHVMKTSGANQEMTIYDREVAFRLFSMNLRRERARRTTRGARTAGHSAPRCRLPPTPRRGERGDVFSHYHHHCSRRRVGWLGA